MSALGVLAKLNETANDAEIDNFVKFALPLQQTGGGVAPGYLAVGVGTAVGAPSPVCRSSITAASRSSTGRSPRRCGSRIPACFANAASRS